MNSLVSYGSDDEVESDHFGSRSSVGAGGKRKEDDTNYDDVNMDLSEDSQGAGSESEQPGAEHAPVQQSKSTRQESNDSRERERLRDRDCDRDRDRDRDNDRDRTSDMRDRRRDKERYERDRERRSPRRDDKYNKDRSERSRGPQDAPRRGLLGDKPRERSTENKVPALMDLKPYGGEPPPGLGRSHDARDAVSPRFVERDRRERDDKRERDRDRESRHSRRSEETRSSRDKGSEHRSRSRGAAYPPPYSSSSSEKRSSPSSGDYRPSSYKVNKKLEVMEKMGLQIKTPDGSMATAQQLRAAASEAPAGSGPGLSTYNNPTIVNSNKILDQVQKRKLLWSNKEKSVAVAEAAKWSGARFAQDNDGKQVSKFMRLMGIKEPAAVKAPEQVDETVDPNKKQEELFQAMQAQYEVARATTHTMRGVGLGFQRGNF